jgi:hypothetical protein
MFPEPEIPPDLLARLVASLEGGKDINNLKRDLHPEATASAMEAEPHQRTRDQLMEQYQPPLQKTTTQHSHHSSKHSAGHSFAFAGGRSHKASLASTNSASSRRMTTEEKMSEVDEFFGLDDDEDGGAVVSAASTASGYVVSDTPIGGALVKLDALVRGS